MGKPAYEACKRAVVERALTAFSTVPPHHERDAHGAIGRNLPAGVVGDLRAALAVFRFRVIPDLLLDVTLVRAMLDGPDAACRSRFSVD